MANYAIGDLQGCLRPLQALLQEIGFHSRTDRLWFAGDLVNRGPDSLGVLRFVRSLGDRAHVVLGNHDLHLLAVASGAAALRDHDTLGEVLAAPDREELLTWLAGRPLLVHDLGVTLVHAGLAPGWSLAEALACAREAESAIRCGGKAFYQGLYGNLPDRWDPSLAGLDRVRTIVNICTRMRYCTPAGNLDFRDKGPPGTQRAGLVPWFECEPRRTDTVLFGHWSTLGVGEHQGHYSLDGGCAWGGRLAALKIETREFFSVACVEAGAGQCRGGQANEG